jgi:flagellar hook-length control protein FliK
VQTSANKAVQAAATATDAAPELKIDATTSSVASTSGTDALTASRTSGVEASKAAQSTPAAQAAPAATIQVYSRMIERFDGRAQRYEIRLDPAELGRVDVRIEVGADKKVHAVLAAHDSAALSDLMRGQRALEASLRQAGIDVADGGIKFELSSDTGRNLSNGANRGDTNGNANGSGNVWRNFSTMDVAVDANTATAARPWRSSRLNLVA